MEMLPMRDGQTTNDERTREDRATQPMEAGGWVSQLLAKENILAPCALSTLCKVIMLILFWCGVQTVPSLRAKKYFLAVCALSTLWIPPTAHTENSPYQDTKTSNIISIYFEDFLDALASLALVITVSGYQFFKTADYEIFRLWLIKMTIKTA